MSDMQNVQAPGRFSYVRYDAQSIQKQEAFKAMFESLEAFASVNLKPSRPLSLLMTALEEAYMWTGKAIRDEQEMDRKKRLAGLIEAAQREGLLPKLPTVEERIEKIFSEKAGEDGQHVHSELPSYEMPPWSAAEARRRSGDAEKRADHAMEPLPARVQGLMDFGGALWMLRADRKVARAGWNGKGQFLGLQLPDAGSMNTLPYIYIVTVQGDRVPWLASQTDMLGRDWIVVE